MLGTADVLRAGRWQAVSVGDALAAGEVVRTGTGSRLAIQLVNGSQLKLNANSRLELKQITPRPEGFVPTTTRLLQNILRIFSGEIWIRSVGEPLQIQTPLATATIRGTEFNLTVVPDDSARLAVLNGVVEFSNPQGSVMVEKNEQATAKPGEAPRKTVLINPLDAVQWSLYYPGIVSYRDYPLITLAPSQQSAQFAIAAQRVTAFPKDVNALIELGELSFDLGKQAQARQAFTQALRLDPTNARARTGLGWVYLADGELNAALKEFQQPQPPSLMTLVGMANALYRLNRLDESNRTLLEAERRFPTSPIPWTQAALNALIQGDVPEARQALDRALKLDPKYAPAYALRSNIALVQNQRAHALEAARQAVAVNPDSPSAWLSLSLVQQAEFQLDDALQSARKAVELDPDNPQALIQESRLLFGQGRIEKAFKRAEQARRKGPQDALVNSTWGFLQLARFNTDKAMAAFKQAIAQNPTLGEPHLGLGITLFRQNKTRKAVEEMEKATLLEPQVSLYQSYLGKAYYEIKQDQLAQKHLNLAKQLDPRDPTPYFYDAILKESINRPVEALQNVQKSIELNGDRAVYRSRLLLDEDLATRDTSMARIYSDLGFDQIAQTEAAKSLSLDPANYSAHQFLSQVYAGRPRYEIARVSERLQSQLLQPINTTPIQPSLAVTNLGIINGTGPFTAALNEYTSLFVRDRPQVLASGVVGNQHTLADEVVLYGNQGRWSYSLGQFYYQNDGFRQNNDQQHGIYNLFTQVAVTPEINLQAEYWHRKTDQGDLSQYFFGGFSDETRFKLNQDTARLGAHFAPSPQSDFIVSLSGSNRETQGSEAQGYQGEAQYIFQNVHYNLTTGIGEYNINREFQNNSWIEQNNAYIYANLFIPKNLIWTIGLSYDRYNDNKGILDFDQFNPKLGLQWDITDNLRLRLATFKTLKRWLIVEQTIEPTQIAGFNQFFDDFNTTKTKNYAIGLDTCFTDSLYAGVEVFHRDLNIPQKDKLNNVFNKQQENFYSAYLYWTLDSNWAIRGEYWLEKFDSDINDPINSIKTISVPLAVRYFNPSGLFGELGAIYVRQKVDGESPEESSKLTDQENFVLLNAAIGYRLPKRWGIISLEGWNLLDKNFRYQDMSFRTSHTETPVDPRFIPERTIFSRITLNF
ncbi:MAG: tetratricopeptide repeat protein [Candidatus Competibacteraceae bacterium]